MQLKTKKVEGRRQVRYESIDDFLADAQRLAGSPVRTLGNWSQGQIYMHLARSLDGSIDGIDMKVAAPMRWMMTLLFKKKFLEDAIPPGFPAPDGPMRPDETSVEDGLAALENAVARQKNEASRVPHPGFGNIGRDGWDKFNLRHTELHMSFIVEQNES